MPDARPALPAAVLLAPPDASTFADTAAAKRAFRRWAREQRRALAHHGHGAVAAGALVAALQAFAPYRCGLSVATYLAFGDEIDLDPLHAAPDKSFAVPRTHVEPVRRLSFHPLSGANLQRHRFGQLEPAATDHVIGPERFDVVLVPGLAFDQEGARLGHGQGFYDRFLTTLRPDVVTLGITFEALVVPSLPCAAHDVRVTHLATERGVRPARAAGTANGAVDPTGTVEV